MDINSILISFSLICVSIGSYLVWFSRWNIYAHLSLGFCITGYIIPIYWANVLTKFAQELIVSYSFILFSGALCYILGVWLGNRIHTNSFFSFKYSVIHFSELQFVNFVEKRVYYYMIFSLIGIAISYIGMGFIPLFAENPFMARFFRGEYADAYRPYAILFRLSQDWVIALIPVSLILWYSKRKNIFFVLSLLGIVAISLSLSRGPIAIGFLIFLGTIVAYRKKWFLLYLVFVGLIFPLGSSLFYLLSIFYEGFLIGDGEEQNIWNIISSGAPDISDQLRFLEAFLNSGSPFTYGRTFIGGLVPFQYEWNPAVWTLDITNSSFIQDIVSGGLRLPVQLWGYASFGWVGVILVPFLSGFISGTAIRITRRYIDSGSILRSIVVIITFSSISSFFINFYTISIHSLPQLIISVLLLFPITFKTSANLNNRH